MRILTTQSHGGWEYEFSKVGHEIVRLSEPGKSTRFGNKHKYPSHVTHDYYENLDKYKDFDILVNGDWDSRTSMVHLDMPKIYVPHGFKQSRVIGEHFIHEEYLPVHTMKFTKSLAGTEIGTVIYNGVTPEDYEQYDVDFTRQTIVMVFNSFMSRPEVGGYDIWMELMKDYKGYVFGGAGNEVFNDGIDMNYTAQDYSPSLVMNRVYVNTTQTSIMPMSIYDAMACGMPIVTTGTCGIPEIIKHGVTGYITNDINEMKRYINRLLVDDEECMRLGRNARKSVLDYYNSSRMAKEWNELMQTLVQQARE